MDMDLVALKKFDAALASLKNTWYFPLEFSNQVWICAAFNSSWANCVASVKLIGSRLS